MNRAFRIGILIENYKLLKGFIKIKQIDETIVSANKAIITRNITSPKLRKYFLHSSRDMSNFPGSMIAQL